MSDAARPPAGVASDDPVAAGSNAAGVGTSPDGARNRICSQPPIAVGFDRTCFAALPRYTFDPRVGKCVFFLYGGCGATSNVFRTETLCRETCPDTTPTPGKLERFSTFSLSLSLSLSLSPSFSLSISHCFFIPLSHPLSFFYLSLHLVLSFSPSHSFPLLHYLTHSLSIILSSLS